MAYTAVVLDERSQNALRSVFSHFADFGWELICHHMTIEFGADSHPEEGQQVILQVDTSACNDLVCAVGISKDCGGNLSTNEIPHVTVAVNREEGGKPVMSNDLSPWVRIEPITLVGTIEVCK